MLAAAVNIQNQEHETDGDIQQKWLSGVINAGINY